ncbi:immunoglobulin-like domain-containing protein [Paenibacillus macerans]|uniref:DUF5011 domain-containing protein n=3 Tax=Paenibacillus macerans TaxID=44252 RepID=A0A090ZFB6_PAEMA|nr:immunoglobulin-like domain-containing protein [Paenibacillus macerans]KFN08930.1 hypothetical protein DJ90_5115 [Paenibacillus macerans]MCY7559418.1 S-layer homology domain-containing protein [Paenibacillus macerans]MEC0154948.1 S-layer homology domain-containing protein [Paenibacillus macerans]SUA83229.1 exoglucanase xynX Exocellobiohydrolase; 1,4-beta-cellobiohydrolase; Flags: Precursor [Paenibacillus macerans]
MSKTKRRTRKNMKLRFLIPLLPAIGGAILMLGQDASAAVVNVTLGKPVTSSGFADPYEPSRAVDGSVQPTSRWYQATAGEKWIQVDLGDIYTLSIWKVTGMGLYYEWSGGLDPYHFHLETSLNGSNWKTVDTVQGNTNPLFQRSLPPVDARYVRLVIDQGNAANNQWASVLEFEAYGELLTAPGTPGNFAGVFQDGAPKLSWDAAAKAATYELRRNGTLIYSGPLTSYTDADVLPAGEITYSVQAVNAKGSSPAAEITVNVPSEAERADEAAAALEIGYAPGDSASAVTQDLTLPLAGLSGTTVSWSSNAPETAGNDGKVTRPAYAQGDRAVEMTAAVMLGTYKVTRTFNITVLREPAETALARAEQELTLGDLTAVAGNLALPETGYGGTRIEWSSNAPEIVAPDGTVHQPAYSKGDKDVTLTAVLRLDGLERVKTFNVHVLSLPINDEEAVAAAYQSLTLPVTTVTYDLDLPDRGANGVFMNWSSSHPEFLNSEGQVTLPSYTDGDQNVTLTATISRGAYSLTKAFPLLLPAQPIRPDEAARLAADSLVLNYPAGIKDSINLPRSGPFDTTIEWASDRPEVLDADGRVNRPRYTDGDAEVHLTATVSKDAAAVQRTFRLTVLKALPNTPYIRLSGTNPVLLESGDSFTDPGATVVDSVYGSILAEGITGTGLMDINTPGIYSLSYDYSGDGWTAEGAEREVHVRPRPVSAAAASSGVAGSVHVSGAVPGARLGLYNSDGRLAADGTASAEGTYTFTSLAENGYYVLQTVNGMASSPSALIYVKLLTAADVAAAITAVPGPGEADTKLQLPAVPDGFTLAISSSSHPEVVQTDGVIHRPARATQVTLVLQVIKVSDGSGALTVPIAITVPGVRTGGGDDDGGQNSGRRSGVSVSSSTLQKSFLYEQGRLVVVYTPSAAYLEQRIRQAELSGMDHASIELTNETGASRVIIASDLLRKFDQAGTSIVSRYATFRLSEEDLLKLAAEGRKLEVTLEAESGAGSELLSSWASGEGLSAAGPAVRISAAVTGTPRVVLPLDQNSAALPANGGTADDPFILAYYTDGTREKLPAAFVYDDVGRIVGVAFDLTASGTFAMAVSRDAAAPSEGVKPPAASGSGAAPEHSWSDAREHWADGALRALAVRGWMQGYEDGTIRPDRPVTRAEFVSVLAKALGKNTDEGGSAAFADLEGHWAASAVQDAYAQGWINGVSSESFAPDAPLTREQAIVILAKALGASSPDSNQNLLNRFNDRDQITAWATSALQQAAASGWIVGYPDGTLKPSGTLSRGETAELLIRAFGLES